MYKPLLLIILFPKQNIVVMIYTLHYKLNEDMQNFLNEKVVLFVILKFYLYFAIVFLIHV